MKWLGLLMIAGYAFLAIRYPAINIMIGGLSFFPFIILMVLLMPPFGGILLGQESATYSFMQWFRRILVSQLLIVIFAMTALLAIFAVGPLFLDNLFVFQQLTQKSMKYALWPWPGFPLVPILIWGLSLAYFTYVKNRTPFYYNYANDLYRGRFTHFGKAYTEMLIQFSTQIAITMAYVSVIMSSILALHWLANIPMYMHNPSVVALIMLMLFCIALCHPAKQIIRISMRYFLDLRWVGLIASLALLFILILIGYAAQKITPYLYNLHISLPFQSENWLKFLAETPNQDRLMLLYWGWWLMLTPLLGSYYAAISRGRQIRTFILGILVMPLIVFILLKQGYISDDINAIWLEWRGWLALVLSLASLIILSFITANKRDTRLIIQGFMPAPEVLKTNRANLGHGTKVFGLSHFVPVFVAGIIMFIFLHATGGWYFMGILFAVFSPSLIIKTCGMSGMLMTQILKDMK